MMDKNIFVVGGQVSGESQIGYERYLDKFTHILSDTNNCISVIGLQRSGKTSVVKEVLKRAKEKNDNLIAIYVNLAMQRSFSELLETIVSKLEMAIIGDNEIYEDRILQILFERTNKADRESQYFRNNIEGIFGFYKKYGKKSSWQLMNLMRLQKCLKQKLNMNT